jgi:undecaprenyl-diphosphatase
MVTVAEACVLGAVQGATEFLPVSSTGHLALAHQLITPLAAEEKVAFDVALHAGTLVAVLVYYRAELWAMAGALLRPAAHGWARTWIWLLAVATLPAAAAGLTFESRIEQSFDSLATVGVCFLVTGVILHLASAVRGAVRSADDLGLGDAIVIGCFQAIALLPGVSRSGSTISGALFRKARPDVAATFSFLLGIPAIAGAIALEAPALGAIGPTAWAPVAAGVVTAGVVGLLAIATLLRVVQSRRLHYFAYYCWLLGAVVLAATLVPGV